MIHRRKKIIIALALATVFSAAFFSDVGISRAATDTWLGTKNDFIWSDAGNWSTGSMPGSGDIALFSASSTGHNTSTMDLNESIAGIIIDSTYTGTLTQASGTGFTIGASGWVQSGGAFVGGGSTSTFIVVSSTFSVTSGTFTSTKGNLILQVPSTTFTPGTFLNNSGTVLFGNTVGSVFISGSSTFNNLAIGAMWGVAAYPTSTGYVLTLATGTVLTANGWFGEFAGFEPVTLLGGEIDIRGDVAGGYTITGGVESSTTAIVLNGTGTQTVDAADVTNHAMGSGPELFLPNLTITKTSGSVNLANTFAVAGNFINTNNTPINPGTSTAIFFAPVGSSSTFSSSSTFYNLVLGYGLSVNPLSQGLYQYGIHNNLTTIATGTVLTVQGYLYLDTDNSTDRLLGGGTINIQGNIEGGYAAFSATGTVAIVLNGTSTQVVDDNSATGLSGPTIYLPNLTVNKSSGIAYVANSPIDTGLLAVTQGELQLATGTTAQTVEIDGPITVNSSARLSDYAQASSTLKFGSSLTNNGVLWFDGSGPNCGTTMPSDVIIRSTQNNVQRSWSGSGTYIMRYANVKDQSSAVAIADVNGVNGGNNSNFTFPPPTVAEPQLVQATASSGGSGTTQLALPAFSIAPRAGDVVLVAVSARNESIAVPTDNASSTYVLVASTTFSSSPSYAVALYYANNIVSTSSFIVTANGANSAGSPYLSASAFEYTGVANSSTLLAESSNLDTSGNAISLSSLSAAGRYPNQLYFGVATLAASTTAAAGSGWTPEVGVTDNTNRQSLYIEDQASTTVLSPAATWTSVASTSYAAIVGIFNAPYLPGYQASGTLDSATFDTGVSGAQLNSFLWKGTLPAGTGADFQFAVSNASSGPWTTFKGPDGTSNTYFSGNPGTSINLLSSSNGYSLFGGYRYFRYRVILFSDSNFLFTPTVTGVAVNWSP